MKEIDKTIIGDVTYIIGVHKELHGKGIVDYAIVDDICRKYPIHDREGVKELVDLFLKEEE